MKKHLGFILFFACVLAAFMWRVISLKAGFIYGDYASQFYPWSLIYSESVKNFAFPFWTRYFHSGFPLMAEGQVGGFYPLNILFFFAMPLRTAYNYLAVFHFALAGVFTYVYARKTGACQWGGALAALLFCFGSAYAGCFVNIPTVKTLAWFPLALWCLEKYFDGRKPIHVLAAGLIFGVQLLAGSTQVALYCFVFYAVYFLYGLKVSGGYSARDAIIAVFGTLLAALIFLPQFLISGTIAELSWRSQASVEFALSDSFSPLNFMSMVFPYPVCRGPRFYIGVLSLLFFITAFFGSKNHSRRRPLLLVLVLAVFLALGKYNPLYVIFIKLTHLYSFRNPSKFLLFGLFAASVMSGWGFTRFFAAGWVDPRRKAIGIFAYAITAMLGLFLTAKAVLYFFGEEIIAFGQRYVAENIYGKGFHRYDLATYTEKVRDFYNALVNSSSLTEPLVLVSVILCLACFIMCRVLTRDARGKEVFHRIACFALIFLDLLAFSVYGTGFRGNILDYSSLKPQAAAVLEAIRSDSAVFRILPYDMASAKLPNWAMPSMNAAWQVDSVALYTPLVNERYRKALEDLEAVDNALGLKTPAPDSLDRNLDLIKMLNVKYVVSPYELNKPFLEPVTEESGTYLYRVDGYLPRAFAAKDLMTEMIDPAVPVEILSYGSGKAEFRLDIPYDGYLVFSENRYPGWEAYVDGERSQILPFSVVQAVKLAAGGHEVRFVYRPFSK